MTFRPVEERIALRRELEKKFEEVQGVIGTDNDLIQIEYLVGGNRRTYTGRLIDHDEENLILYYLVLHIIDLCLVCKELIPKCHLLNQNLLLI